MTELRIERLGRVPYTEALERQMKCVEARRSGAGPDRLLLLEHPPVITLGRRARRAHLLQSPDQLAVRGVEIHSIARGGDVTYHAPGQLVGYAIIDLRARGCADVHAFLRELEGGIGEALAELGVSTRRVPGCTGVFAAQDSPHGRPRKLASIGIGMRGWVTCHGFALNVDLDLAGFEAIVPCGLHGVEMTSLARELGTEAPADLGARALDAVAGAFARRWA